MNVSFSVIVAVVVNLIFQFLCGIKLFLFSRDNKSYQSLQGLQLAYQVFVLNGGVWETGPSDGASKANHPNQNKHIKFISISCILWFYEYIQALIKYFDPFHMCSNINEFDYVHEN